MSRVPHFSRNVLQRSGLFLYGVEAYIDKNKELNEF